MVLSASVAYSGAWPGDGPGRSWRLGERRAYPCYPKRMDAARTTSAFDLTRLEGLSRVDELAQVIGLGAALDDDDIDERARGGIEFLLERLRSSFIAPALETRSRAAFFELWKARSLDALRQMDGVFQLLGEARLASASQTLPRRLALGDRQLVRASARVLGERFGLGLEGELALSLNMIEDARALFDELPAGHTVAPADGERYSQGVLMWAIGVHLCQAVAEQSSDLAGESPRSELGTNAVELASAGARLASFFAMGAAGFEIDEGAETSEWPQLLQSTAFVALLLRTTREVLRAFEPGARLVLREFRYPNEPESRELHLTIVSEASATVADATLDRLCDEWWDDMAARLDVDIHLLVSAPGHG